MKKVLLFVMVVILMGFTGCISQNEIEEDTGKEVYTKTDIIMKILGTWSNVEYMNNLNLTKSPYNSIVEVPWIDIRMENTETVYDEYLNFHEGGTGGTITDIIFARDKNRYDIKLKEYVEGSALDFKRSLLIDENDSEQYSIIYTNLQDEEKFRFSKIGKSPELYANEVILAGKYKDEKGEEYTFTNNEEAFWPNETFNYRIQLDFIGQETFVQADGSYYNADYFIRTAENGVNVNDYVYYYEVKEDQLYIFKAYEKEGVPFYEIKEVPDLVLTKQ
jgi:hypothetical protein